MAVFTAMQPVLHEQYPTGAGGGVAAPGRGGYTGNIEALRGVHPPPNPLEDKDAAVSRVLRMLGINPGSMSPTAQALRRQAGALVNELALSAGSGLPGAADVLASPASALGALADIVRQGLAGGKIYGGKAGNLEGLLTLARGAETGTDTSAGAGVVQQLLSSAKNTAELFRQAKYGGLSDQAQGAMASGLLNILDAYSSQLSQNPEAGLTSGVSGLMNMLLGRPMTAGGSTAQAPTDAYGAPLGGGGAAGGALGAGGSPGAAATASALGLPPGAAGTPSTAQAAPPSALADTAALQLPPPDANLPALGQNWLTQILGMGNLPTGTPYGPSLPGTGASPSAVAGMGGLSPMDMLALQQSAGFPTYGPGGGQVPMDPRLAGRGGPQMFGPFRTR